MVKQIIVVEDDENIREMVSLALRSFGYDAAAFANAEDALAAIEISTPAMAIFDIMLPGMNGLEAVKHLREQSKTRTMPILLLTAKDTELDKVVGLDCGADDYMTKPFGVMELGARVRNLLRRITPDEPLHEFAGLCLNDETREVMLHGAPVALTFKEYELLRMLVNQRGRIVPREQLLDEIWGIDFVGESRTLDIHIRTLRQKLGDDADHPHFIKTVRNVGYRFIGDQT